MRSAACARTNALIAHLEQQIAQITESARRVTQGASEAAIPEAYKRALSNDYAARIRGLRTAIDLTG